MTAQTQQEVVVEPMASGVSMPPGPRRGTPTLRAITLAHLAAVSSEVPHLAAVSSEGPRGLGQSQEGR